MIRAIFAFISGLAVWLLVTSLLNRGLRVGLEGYAAAEPKMTFTHGMMAARLALSALASLATGAVAMATAPSSKRVPWVLGAFLLAAFIPVHVKLWAKFRVWYHLVFLGTLVPLVLLGATLARNPRQSRGRASEDFSWRHLTSHERLSGQPWDASYRNGPAPWDIGRPQPAIVRLASEGGFAGAVLDAGCGTGENALHVASLGLSVLGVDVAETALAIARKKAADRGIEVKFAGTDAFQLDRLGRMFQTVLDCGLFHTFDGDERTRYVASLASVTEHDGTLYVLCFSDQGPDIGPHPTSQEELRASFNPGNGWDVAAIEPERTQTRFHDHGAPAWFATIKRI